MSVASTISSFAKRHAPEILTVGACVGVGVTSILASKATLEAHDIMSRNDLYKTSLAEKDSDGKKDQITHFTKYILPAYIPAAISAGATIACMVGAHSIDVKRISAMASICAASTNALEAYKNNVSETVGDKKAAEIAQNVVQKQLDANPKTKNENDIQVAEQGTDSLWYDLTTGRYFYATMEYMRRAEADLKNDLLDNDIVTLNDIYDRIGLDEVKLGDSMGFDIKRGDQVTFVYDTAMSDDDQPMCTVSFPVSAIY